MISITRLIYEGVPPAPSPLQTPQPYSSTPTSLVNKIGMMAGAVLPLASVGGMMLTGYGQTSDGMYENDPEHPGQKKLSLLGGLGMGLTGVGMAGMAALSLPKVLKNTKSTYETIKAQQDYERQLKQQNKQFLSPPVGK